MIDAGLLAQLRDAVVSRVIHSVSDLDRAKNAQHHTLGKGVNQASPGPHLHDGKDSVLLDFGGLMADPLITSGGTTAGTTELVIGSITVKCVKGVRYSALWTVFDANTSVAGDRFTFRVAADPGSGPVTMDTPVTIAFPSTAVATGPVPPIYGTWVSTVDGNVTFSIRIVRAAGTGTISVGGGALYVKEEIYAKAKGTPNSGASSSTDSWISVPGMGGSFSVAAFAWKGNRFTPNKTIKVYALGVAVTTVVGGVYKGAIVEGNAASGVTAITFTNATFTGVDTNSQYVWLDFATPVTLNAGTMYSFMFGRTDSTGTYALPAQNASAPAGTAAAYALPGITDNTATRIAVANPVVGSAIDNAAVGGSPYNLAVRVSH